MLRSGAMGIVRWVSGLGVVDCWFYAVGCWWVGILHAAVVSGLWLDVLGLCV